MSDWKFLARLCVLSVMIALAALLCVGRLYRLQIVEQLGASPADERRYTTTETVTAVRGEILDSYGRPLVTNSTNLYVDLDLSILVNSHATANANIAELLRLCELTNTPHVDTFPITALPPFAYIDDMNDSQRSRLERWLTKQEWPTDISAADLMTKLRKTFRLDDSVSDADARAIIGVRYELALRYDFGGYSAYRFADSIGMELVTALTEANLKGITAAQEAKRSYTTHLAAHILGRTGPIFAEEYETLKAQGYALDATIGKDGMEKALESFLRGVNGKQAVETNTSGSITNIEDTLPAEPGNHCLLTLDLDLQRTAEQSLANRIAELQAGAASDNSGTEADAGAVVVIDVNTGAVLAMASYPTFSLADFSATFDELQADPTAPLFNRAIAGTYAPGSTFKMSAGLAMLDNGTISPSTTIVDKGIFTAYANVGYAPMCGLYKSNRTTHGSLTIAEALQVSCNYFFYDAAYRAGIAPLESTAQLLGFGQKSGIELENESAGVLAGPTYRASKNKIWNPGDTLQMAIGQSDTLATPLQLANYVATIANGGTRYQPYLLKSVVSSDYSEQVLLTEPTIVTTLDVKSSHLAAVQKGMRMVCQSGGTAYHIFGDYPVAVAAKTGSAQVNGKTNGVFVTYAPYDNPQIAIAVIVEKGDSGGNIAPIARDIYDCYFAKTATQNGSLPENQLLP